MDSTLLQLFTAEEILQRLSDKGSTGALHVFTSKESANLFFRDGLIVAAAKGLLEGEEVIRQVLEWKEARFIWQAEVTPQPQSKPLEIEFADFLARMNAAPKLAIGGKTLSESGKKGDSAKIPPEPIKIPQLPLKPAARTGVLAGKTGPVGGPGKPLTATKHIDPGQAARTSHEEALLKKHPLVLLPGEGEAEGMPTLRITRLSSLIGRNPACDFPLDHTSISRQHCLLQITDRGLHVKDLGTTNGTKVNGIVMTEGYINIGDTLTMGSLSFFLDRDEAAAL